MDKQKRKKLKQSYREMVLRKTLEEDKSDWCHYSSSLYGEDTDHTRNMEDEIVGSHQVLLPINYFDWDYRNISIRKCSKCGKKYCSSELDPPIMI